jgi:hypothetical protein
MSKSDSRSRTDSSPGPPLDHGLPSPEEAHEHDVTYREDMDTPGDVAVRDLKGKGKAREQIFSPIVFPGQIDHTPRSDYAPFGADDIKEPYYLSPPLTVSEKFRLQVENLSWVFRRGLVGSALDFDVDLGLESGSGSGSEGSSSPGGGGGAASSVSSVGSGPEEEGVVHTAAFEEAISEGEESLLDEGGASSTATASTVEATSSRRATIGDTTLQDPGPVSAVVRFPSIFMQDGDMSTLASSGTETGGSTPLALFPYPLPDSGSKADDEVWQTLGEDLVLLKSGDDKRGRIRRRTENYAEVRVKHATRRTFRRRRRRKIQEKRLCEFSRVFFFSLKGMWPFLTIGFFNTARDFFLIVTLCFGMACAGILVLRPALMALFGYGTLGGRLEFD